MAKPVGQANNGSVLTVTGFVEKKTTVEKKYY